MTKKIIISVLALTLYGNVHGQVGINTENPTSALDINGSLRIVKELLVGGNDITPGSEGTEDQALVSKGAGFAPEWQTVTTPVPDTGEWFLIGSFSRSDTKGGLKLESNSGSVAYASDYTVRQATGTNSNVWTVVNEDSRPWLEFEDFRFELAAFDAPVRIIISIQVLAQAYWQGETNPSYTQDCWRSYALAAFRHTAQSGSGNKNRAKMAAVRQGSCRGSRHLGNNSPSSLCTMIATIDIPANESSVFSILGTLRASQGIASAVNPEMTLGKVLTSSIENDALQRQATMRVDVYKQITSTP